MKGQRDKNKPLISEEVQRNGMARRNKTSCKMGSRRKRGNQQCFKYWCLGEGGQKVPDTIRKKEQKTKQKTNRSKKKRGSNNEERMGKQRWKKF